MPTHTEHGSAVKAADGYGGVRAVAQTTEGVRLDAQHDKRRASCKFHRNKRIDIAAAEKISAARGRRS